MSTPAKLTAFATVLAALFGGAAAVGALTGANAPVGYVSETRAATETGAHGSDAEAASADGTSAETGSDTGAPAGAHGSARPGAVPGLAVAQNGLRLVVDDPELRHFGVFRNGRQVRVEPYLGAGGHLVALREGDLAFLHVRPADDHGDGADEAHDDSIGFAATFPTAGRYRLFVQVKHAGPVHTVALTQEVR